jgi:hypothetical protein
VAAGIPPIQQLSRFMGHAKVTTTTAVYTHLFGDDHAETMAALAAMSPAAPDVVPLRRRGYSVSGEGAQPLREQVVDELSTVFDRHRVLGIVRTLCPQRDAPQRR